MTNKTATAYTATAPNGTEYRFNAKTKPAAVRFLDRGGVAEDGLPYIISTHKTEAAATTSFQTPAWRKMLIKPGSAIVTDIREA